MNTRPITVSGQQCTGDTDEISLNMGNTCNCGQNKVGGGKLPPHEEDGSDSGETTLAESDVDSRSFGCEQVTKADDRHGSGRDKLVETDGVETVLKPGRVSESTLAERYSSQCRRRINAKSDNEDSMLSFSDKLTSVITTLNCEIGVSEKRTKQQQHVSFQCPTSTHTTGGIVTPQVLEEDASPTPTDGNNATMLCKQCRTSVGRECVVPAKVNLLRCESKLDELMQRVDSHYRRLSVALHEINVLEHALSHDGATGETIRKYGPLLLADRYVAKCNNLVLSCLVLSCGLLCKTA